MRAAQVFKADIELTTPGAAQLLQASPTGFDAPSLPRGVLSACIPLQFCPAQMRLSSLRTRGGVQASRLDPSRVPPGRPFVLLRLHATCCGSPMFNTWHELPTCSFFGVALEAEPSRDGTAAAAVAAEHALGGPRAGGGAARACWQRGVQPALPAELHSAQPGISCPRDAVPVPAAG